jgi:hypothetical protein
MTFGERLLDELGKSMPVDAYLSPERQAWLKRVDSEDEFNDFLRKNRMGPVLFDGDLKPPTQRSMAVTTSLENNSSSANPK